MKLFMFLIVLFFAACSKTSYLHWETNTEYKILTNKTVAFKIELPDYMLSGNIAGVKRGKIILLDYKINEIPENFFERYSIEKLKRFTGFKVCSFWDTNFFDILVDTKIIDYYIDFDKKEVVLKASVGKRIYENRLKFKKDFLEAFRYAYDEFLIFIANNIKERV